MAPITFYLENATDPTIKIIQDIFTGRPDIDEENPLPPCDGSHYNILKSALERRSNLLSDEIEEARKRRVDNIKTHALIRHYRKLEVMLDALDRATGCNKYGQVPADGITVQDQRRLEDLTRQFAFLVLQGIDPIDLAGDATLLRKSANAKSLIQLLEINKVTDTELTRYLNMRKTIPTFIMNILDMDGAGRASFQKAIDEMVLEKQIEIVLNIIEVIKGSTIGGEFDDTPIKNLPPIEQITWIINWLVSKYVECNDAAMGNRRTIQALTQQAEELQANIQRLTEESARMKDERDAAITAKTAAEVAKARAEGDAARAREEKDEVQRHAADLVIEIGELQRQLEGVTAQLRAEQAKVAQAAGLQTTLDEVSRQLRDMTAQKGALETQLRITQERAAAAEAALAAAKARADSAEAALAAYKESHPDTGIEELARLRGELAAAKAAEAAAKAAADAARADLERANEKVAAADSAASAANQRATTAEAEVARLRGEIAASKATLADYERRLAEAVRELTRLRDQNDEIRRRYGGLEDDKAAKDAQLAGISGNAAAAAARERDALARLAAKEAELDALRRKCIDEADRLKGLQEDAAAAKRDLAEEKAKTAKLLDYLARLSTAITNGRDLPAPEGIPQIGDLMKSIGKLRASGDPSKYLCLLSYYVKFFMNLLFNQRGGKRAYMSVKDSIAPRVGLTGLSLIDPEKTYAYLESLKSALDGNGGDTNLTDPGLQTILTNVFGDAGPLYQSIAAFVVASQLYLSHLNINGKLPGCRVADVIANPMGYLPRGDGFPAPAAPAPPARAPLERVTYDYIGHPDDPYRVTPSAAGKTAFNVADDDTPPVTYGQTKAAPSRGDKITLKRAEDALEMVKYMIQTYKGGAAPDRTAKTQYRTETNILDAYCKYPDRDQKVCSSYDTAIRGMSQIAKDKLR